MLKVFTLELFSKPKEVCGALKRLSGKQNKSLFHFATRSKKWLNRRLHTMEKAQCIYRLKNSFTFLESCIEKSGHFAIFENSALKISRDNFRIRFD